MNGKVVLHKKKPANNKFLESYNLYGFSFTFQVSNSMLIMFFSSSYLFVLTISLHLQVWTYEIVWSIDGRVANRASVTPRPEDLLACLVRRGVT